MAEETDNALLDRFEEEVWSKVPHLEEKDGETNDIKETTLFDFTTDYKECSKRVFKSDFKKKTVAVNYNLRHFYLCQSAIFSCFHHLS